jgi:EAL domain-containing protein (putative c-di-GMP-specific phosphodiesterase class I)
VQAAIHDPMQRQVVAAILEIARALGIETLAEGVETDDDIKIIQELGCQLFQGFAYAKPMSADDFCAYLDAHQSVPQTQSADPKSLPKSA